MFSSSFDQNKLKSNLRISMQRLKLLQKKKTEISLKSRHEVAEYIKANKLDRARIRVEHIIREDYLVEAMEIVEMYLDLFLSRYGLFTSTKGCDEGLKEAISTIIWVTPRLQADIPELKIISSQILLKYGKEFIEKCLSNSEHSVNSKVMHKLNLHAPPCNLCELYCIEIARSYDVPFTPDQYLLNGGSAGNAQAPNTPLVDLGEPPEAPTRSLLDDSNQPKNTLPYPIHPRKNTDVQPSIPPLPNQSDSLSFPGTFDAPPPYNSGGGKNDDMISFPTIPVVPSEQSQNVDEDSDNNDFDDLSARFNRLKNA